MDLFFTLFSSKNFSKILIKNNVGQLLLKGIRLFYFDTLSGEVRWGNTLNRMLFIKSPQAITQSARVLNEIFIPVLQTCNDKMALFATETIYGLK
jgi:hypothetical protein